MKGIAIVTIYVLSTALVYGQEGEKSSAIFRDTVPLFIQAGLFAKRSPLKGDFTFYSRDIKVSVAQHRDYMIADAFIQQSKKSLDSLLLLQIEYCLQSQTGSRSVWRSVPANKVLIDTNLREKSKVILQFRIKSQINILQQTTLQREDWRPEIYAYRISNFSDSLNNKLAAKAVYEDSRLPTGFSLADESLLKIPAGKNAELAFINHEFNIDSCIEFRIADNVSKQFSQWRKTGHLLTLKNLVAKHHYTLETRYKGDVNGKPYQILVLPFWWQTVWAILSFVLAGITIISLSIYLVLRRRKKIAEHRIALGIEKYKKEQNKLDPHWLDNMFHTLLGFIRNNQNDLADEYLGKASSILRDKLIHGERLLIPFDDDMKILNNFISNERLKCAFDYTIYIDPVLETKSIQLPPILWQASLENAIKHGNVGVIDIYILKRKDDLVIEIRNTGQFKPVNSNKGFGIPITTERVNGWNMANPGSRIQFTIKQVDNEIVARFIFEQWLA